MLRSSPWRLSLLLLFFNLGVFLNQLRSVHASPPFVLPDDTPQRKPNFNARISSSVKDDHQDAKGVSSAIGIGSASATSTSSTRAVTSRIVAAKELNNNNISRPVSKRPIRVAFQGEPGAYSEKALRELLGPNVIAVPRPDFESCYRAVASGEVEYACLPFENSLGGSIHDNYDLILRYDLQIVAEHDCRVRHCLHVVDGVKKGDIKYCMSHPQALAQCDNYLRSLGIKPIPMYDTAGSVKLLKENSLTKDGVTPERQLPDKCNPGNTAAIASDLAGETYGLTCLEKGIEDDDSNFTRFLLLGRSGVSQYLNKNIPSKTSIVFTLPNTPGALYKALACFSLREIDFSKIESRPTSASLLNYLRFKSQQRGNKSQSQADLPRFRYCFYLDFLANDLDEQAQNALHHLREQAEFCKILGSYPQKSKLVGPVHDEVENSKLFKVESRDDVVMMKLPSDDGGLKLNIGIIGFDAFGQFLGRKFAEDHKVRCLDSNDKTKEADALGVEYYPLFEAESFLKQSDIIVLAVPMIDFESTVLSLPKELLKNKLVVEVCPLGSMPKSILLENLPKETDIISSNPMFGPTTSKNNSWDGQPLTYEKVRILDDRRAGAYLKIFEKARCRMVQMTAEQQDIHTADAEFVTHLVGRLLGSGKILPATPVSSKEYAALCDVTDMTSSDNFDEFYGMYKYNPRAQEHISALRENLAKVERQLVAKEAFLAAKSEMKDLDRQRLIAECRQLLHEVAKKQQQHHGDDDTIRKEVSRIIESSDKKQ